MLILSELAEMETERDNGTDTDSSMKTSTQCTASGKKANGMSGNISKGTEIKLVSIPMRTTSCSIITGIAAYFKSI